MSSKRVNLLLVLATLATLSSCKFSDQEEESTTYDSEPRSRMMEILDIAKSKMARNLQTINLDKTRDKAKLIENKKNLITICKTIYFACVTHLGTVGHKNYCNTKSRSLTKSFIALFGGKIQGNDFPKHCTKSSYLKLEEINDLTDHIK